MDVHLYWRMGTSYLNRWNSIITGGMFLCFRKEILSLCVLFMIMSTNIIHLEAGGAMHTLEPPFGENLNYLSGQNLQGTLALISLLVSFIPKVNL